MILRILILMLCLPIAFLSYGQEMDTVYFGSDWKPSSKAQSFYFRITKTIVKGKKYEVADYYKTGELQMTGTYSSLSPQVREGEFNWYYRNGNKKNQHFYNNNQLQSETSWDENGRETFKKEYQIINVLRDGKLIKDNVSMDKFPKYPGGMTELYKYLGQKFVYPNSLLKARPVGKIVINFTVEEDGSIADARVSQSVHPLLDAEAIRVIKEMPKWIPGYQNGKPVKVAYNIPININ